MTKKQKTSKFLEAAFEVTGEEMALMCLRGTPRGSKPVKEVHYLDESEIIPAIGQDEAKELREIELREQIMSIFGAYQHFLYYFDQSKYEKDQVHGGHLTKHFLDKLAYYRNIHSTNGCNTVEVLVTWVQNMSLGNQETLLTWIVANHSNKWRS